KAGGRCLNYACIPAKTVLHTAEVFAEVSQDGADLGIKSNGTSIDWKGVRARHEKVSKTLEEGTEFLWNKNKAEFLKGEGALAGNGKVKVGDDEHQAKAIVLATGSVAMPIPGVDFSDRVIDTWGAYSRDAMPKRLGTPGRGGPGRGGRAQVPEERGGGAGRQQGRVGRGGQDQAQGQGRGQGVQGPLPGD